MKFSSSRLIFGLALLTVATVGNAQRASPEALFRLVVEGATCRQDSEGYRCEYVVGKSLKFLVRDEGNKVYNISFRHSDIADDFYAVMYDGCVVVTPGTGHPMNFGRDYGVYIAPVNGMAYRTLEQCKAAGR